MAVETDTSSNSSGVRSEQESIARKQSEPTATRVGDRARASAKRIEKTTSETLSSVGRRMTLMAKNVRQKSPKEGKAGAAVESVARSLEKGGRYLADAGPRDVIGDVSELMRRHPMQSLWIGLGLGFLAGALTARKR